MKDAVVFLIILFRVVVANAIVARGEFNVAAFISESKNAEPAPAPMPSPAPSKEAFHISFEVNNLNYYDLTKKTCTQKPHKSKWLNSRAATMGASDSHGKHGHRKKDVVDKMVQHIDNVTGELSDVIGNPVKWVKDTAEAVQNAAWHTAESVEHDAEEEAKVAARTAESVEHQTEQDVNKAAHEAAAAEQKSQEEVMNATSRTAAAVNTEAERAENIATEETVVVKNKATGTATSVKDYTEKDVRTVTGHIPNEDEENTASSSLLQLVKARRGKRKCTTVMQLVREAIQMAIRDVILSVVPAHMAGNAASDVASPAPSSSSKLSAAPPGARFLQHRLGELNTSMMVSGPSPAPQTASPHPAEDVNIFVTFAPGKSVGSGMSTTVDIAITDKPGDIYQGALATIPALKKAIDAGVLKVKIEAFISDIINFQPKILQIDAGIKKTFQWPIQECEKHLKELVGHFGVHYTREQVPRALYNECTNFLTRISFSHDYVLDPVDTTRCQQTTAKFAEQWKYGNNVTSNDFQSMCETACKAKFGKLALQCSID